MIPREFDSITKTDIEALVVNAVTERRTIEYKQQLPGNSDDEKREFLADVSSFANAAGGDIIYGITEQRDDKDKPTGIPEKADGLVALNADAEKLRLEEIIRSGIDPRVPGMRIGHYDGFPSGPVIVIRVPKSWASPHMVTFKNLSRFFTRNSAGKYQLDVREIRAAFTASGDLRAKITAFRTERLGKIIAKQAPIDLPAIPKIVLHLVPLTILDATLQVDLTPLWHDPNLAAPIHNNVGYDRRYNLDGYFSYGLAGRDQNLPNYCQVFRSGAFEAVDTAMFNQSEGGKIVASTSVETKMLNAFARYLTTAERIGVPLPLIVMVTVFGLKGYSIMTGSMWQNDGRQIDRDALLFPDVLVEDYKTPADLTLKPIFDAFWQSAGFPACQHYNAQGHWDRDALQS